jgi:tetratricopeptide (TPR) repeat protein
MIRKLAILALMQMLLQCALSAQDAEQHFADGNNKFRQGKFAEAEMAYSTGIRLSPERMDLKYNRAIAMLRQNKVEEALKEWDDITFKALDPGIKAKAYYNKGVMLSGQKRLDESIEAYKNALRYDPSDQQARENLQKALNERKKQQPKKQKEDQQKKQQKPQPQPKMSEQEARRRLELLEQKEKNVKDRLQKQKSPSGGRPNDW